MVELYSKSPLASLSEIEIGTLKVEEVNSENIISVQPFKGKGKLVISYNDLEELEGILDHIR